MMPFQKIERDDLFERGTTWASICTCMCAQHASSVVNLIPAPDMTRSITFSYLLIRPFRLILYVSRGHFEDNIITHLN